MKATILASIAMGSLVSIVLAAPVGAAEPLRLTEPQMDVATAAGFSLQLSAVAVASEFGHATATTTATISTQDAQPAAVAGGGSGDDGLKGVVNIRLRNDGVSFSKTFALMQWLRHSGRSENCCAVTGLWKQLSRYGELR